PNDAPEDAQNDAGQDSGGDGGEQDGSKQNQPPDAGENGDAKSQDQQPDAGDPRGQDAAPPKDQPQESPNTTQDERMLDMLEQAPTLQQHDAKNRALGRAARGMEDK